MPVPLANTETYSQISANASAQVMGKTGSAIVTTGVTWAASTGYPQVCMIQCLTDTTFSTLSGPDCWSDSVGSYTVVAATDVITTSAVHGLSVGSQWSPSRTTGTIPGGLVLGQGYWVISVPTTSSMTISATPGGPTLDITTAGSVTNYWRMKHQPMYNLTGGALTSVTFLAGTILTGNYTEITINAGTAVFYIG